MLYRFPPSGSTATDPTFLTAEGVPFSKLKIESKAGKRTVFLTEHTLIFVIKGVKLLHFKDGTLQVTPDQVFLLRKGIYVMAEYIQEGLEFEALMLFLPEAVLRSFIRQAEEDKWPNLTNSCVVFPINPLVKDFRDQFRQYFEHRLFDYSSLLLFKQKEILALLIVSGYKEQVLNFIYSALSKNERSMDMVVNDNILRPITIAELAGLCNRSLAAFKRDFQKQYYTSPRVYINGQRLQHARMLLQNTDKLVAEIAEECGFESVSHFIRIFKKEFGITPQGVRAKSIIS